MKPNQSKIKKKHKIKLSKLFNFFLSVIILLPLITALPISISAETTDDSYNDTEYTEPFSYVPMFNLPNNIRGAIISPEIDFYIPLEGSENEINDSTHNQAMIQLDTILDEMSGIGLNTIIIKTSVAGRTYYNLDMNGNEYDLISAAVQKAKSRFFNVYLIYDIMPVLERHSSESKTEAMNSLISEAHRFAIKYTCDGIILDSYYSENSSATFSEYMQNGSGIGYNNWLYDSTEYYFATVSNVIRTTDNSIPVGIMINDCWANASSIEGGSPTQDSVQALFDGYADTKKYIEDGYADFTIVRAYGSLYDEKLPFTETAEWWGELCENAGIPMYLIHYNEKIGSSYSGWSSEDQLLQQLTTSKKLTAYNGSIFNSFVSLSENPLNSTAKITQFFNDQINEESLFNELNMTSPVNYNFTTYEPVVDFAGSFDENFDVYFNGNRITLNSAGRFYFEEPLSIGANVFTFKHKDKTYTYKIERKIIVMRELDSSIAEGKTLNVDGGTSVNIEAVAYKGAEVVATINGQTIKLKQRSTVSQDDDLNTSYASYTGKYIVPDGIEEQVQNLGQIVVQASYMGNVKTLNGASVTVNAKPKPPVVEVEIEKEMFDQDSIGSGEVAGTIDPVKPESEIIKFVKVNGNNTHVLDAKDTGTVYTPEFNQLPAGTIDYFKADLNGFYTTESGKRFFAKDVSLIDGTSIGENELFVVSSGTYNGESYFRIKLDERISYRIEAVDLNYYSEWGGDYNISGFNANYIYITFDNVTSVTKLPDFESNEVFSAGSWEQVVIDGIPKFRLVLKLRQPGGYMGNNAYYNNDGELMLTFPVMQSSLSALTIVIDPGHGYGKDNPSTYDPGAIGHVIEQEVNVQIAKILTDKLKEQGANVIRLETESKEKHYLTVQRPIIARSYGCDIFISIHANRVQGDDSVRGTEVYYFTPFSQPLAFSISSKVASYFSNNVYADGANKNRGAKNLDFWVLLQQDFPSVLIETGWVSNLEEAMALADPTHQAGIADAIVAGIKEYISRSAISHSTNGSVEVQGGNNIFIPELTTPPETVLEIIDTHEVIKSPETTETVTNSIDETQNIETTGIIDSSAIEEPEIIDSPEITDSSDIQEPDDEFDDITEDEIEAEDIDILDDFDDVEIFD